MSDADFLWNTLLGDIMKVAKVNMLTEEYQFIKKIDTAVERRCLQEKTISGYIMEVVKEGVIHPEDEAEFVEFTDIENVRRQIEKGKRHFVHSYRRRFGDVYTWITFVLSVPATYSIENPWVVFRWEITDDDHHMLEDSLRILSTIFHKILKVNLTDDSYIVIKSYDGEMDRAHGFDGKISVWLKQFALCGNVHDEDRQEYLRFANINRMRAHFKDSRDCMRCRYRRKTGGTFRWVSMELVPGIEYSDDNQVVMLYIRDVHDEYISELHYQKELEFYCNTDIMTGLWNRYYYNRYFMHLSRRHLSSLGIVFADLNGLKRVNDQQGHAQGDVFIKGFADTLIRVFGKECCCRMSGDEFLVWQEDTLREVFEKRVGELRDELAQREKPAASIGTAWTDHVGDLDKQVKDAELLMYEEKENYYSLYPEDRR